jgi:DNA-binding response OmpR family regulator
VNADVSNPDVASALKPKALAVEDDEALLDWLSMCLEKMGYDVMTATDGMAALNLCGEHVFDLVLCDIRMPKLSGLSFLKNARNRNPKSVRRVIFISSLADGAMKREVADAGGAALLSKPVTLAQLVEAVRALPK